jgi:hypothetical protein
MHKRFDARASSTAEQIAFAEKPSESVAKDGTRDLVTITFGTGDITGMYMLDKVCLGPESQLCCKANFVAATEESEEPFSIVPFDGILGLSLPQMAEGQSFSMMDDLMRSGALKENVFAVFFGNENEDSEISFGSYSVHHMSTPLLWVPVTVPGYWQVAMNDIAINDNATGICAGHDGGCQAAVDTGTSLLAGPSDVVVELVDKLGVAPDCSNIDDLPDIGFMIGNMTLNLSPEDYISRSSYRNECSIGIMSVDVPPPKGPLFILGDPFLKKYYTVYDQANLRVGFARARHRPAILDTPDVEDESLLSIAEGSGRRSRLLRGLHGRSHGHEGVANAW